MRKSGILMHISSLPSPCGIGTLGLEARRFIDFLSNAGQSLWQVLPISPTGFGDSPYQSFSSYAGNPYFIDLDLLFEWGYLQKEEYQNLDWGDDESRVDYGRLFENRKKPLSLAAKRLFERGNADYDRFCLENAYWLEDYALFMAIKDSLGGAPWSQWEDALRFRNEGALNAARSDLGGSLSEYKALQFFFYTQWEALRAYAHSRGVEIIGDIPIYAAPDSADVWAHPKYFMLDENLSPTEVAGCPPDGFTPCGQLWGNPLYDWSALRSDGYGWWIKRIDHQFKLFDILRIDHFRGLDSFYAIPADARDAANGRWLKGPGMELFSALGARRIIAEDLGFLTDSVRELLRESGYPGMKVLQFAFDSREESDYLPHNFVRNCVAYTGTHDNSTIRGWFAAAPETDALKAREYMRIAEGEDAAAVMLSTLWASTADTAIAAMQDLLGLDDRARMNTPGTLGGNWQWRMQKDTELSGIAERLRAMTTLYGRSGAKRSFAN